MYYMLDNYDSFVYNLAAYMRELCHEIVVRRADEYSIEEIRELNPEGIIISPGPGRPREAKEAKEILEEFAGKVPILGVCLGHQVIGEYFGATVAKGERPMHGKISEVDHSDSGVFSNLQNPCKVTRYHSLQVMEDSLPEELEVTARSTDQVIMGIRHKNMPVFGVQFHPEAVLTDEGHSLLHNFCDICDSWRDNYED